MDINDYIVLLPHGYPIKMIDKVLELNEKISKTSCIIKMTNPFLEKDNSLSEMAYIELIAQTSAIFLIYQRYANKGYTMDDLLKIKEEGGSLGFLVSITMLKIFSSISVSDEVEVLVTLTDVMDDYYGFKANIIHEKKIISSGELSIYAE